jgi:fatty-acyl-CoA synthase
MFDAELSAQITRTRSHGLGDLLRRSAARLPGKTATIYQGLRQSYAELDETVNRMANALTERGVARGDRVALLSHNHHAFVVAYFALARLGAVSVPVNFMLTADEVSYILEHSGASGLIAEDALVPVAEQAIAQSAVRLTIRGVISGDGSPPPPGWEPVTAWMAHRDASPADVTVADEELAQLIYTSGTESRPKGAMLSSRSLIAQYVTCIVEGQMSADDIEVHSLPLYHCAQLHCFLTPGIYLGATNIVLATADPATILETIEAERATKLFCPPTVWISLLRHPDFDRRDLSSLRKGYYGASIMPVEVLREITARLPDVRLFNFYGQTEMAPLATVLAPEDQVRKAGSAGGRVRPSAPALDRGGHRRRRAPRWRRHHIRSAHRPLSCQAGRLQGAQVHRDRRAAAQERQREATQAGIAQSRAGALGRDGSRSGPVIAFEPPPGPGPLNASGLLCVLVVDGHSTGAPFGHEPFRQASEGGRSR